MLGTRQPDRHGDYKIISEIFIDGTDGEGHWGYNEGSQLSIDNECVIIQYFTIMACS